MGLYQRLALAALGLGLVAGVGATLLPRDMSVQSGSAWGAALSRAQAMLPDGRDEKLALDRDVLMRGILMPEPAGAAARAAAQVQTAQLSDAGRPVPAEPRVLAASIKDGKIEVYLVDGEDIARAAIGEATPSGWIVDAATLDMVDLSFDNVQLSLDISPSVGQKPPSRR